MEVEQLADEVEMWISRFYSNIADNFSMIPTHLWEFIWFCINALKVRYPSSHCFHNCIERHARNIEFRKHVVNVEYNATETKQWLLKMITSIPKTEYFYLELLLRDEPVNKITIRVCSNSKCIQTYIYFMQCLFPDANKFQFTEVVSSTVSQRMRFQRHHQLNRARPIPQPRWYCNWILSKSTYQRCLQLFPRWPITFHHTCFFDEDLLACVSTWMISDLAKICIGYLPTFLDYPAIRELPQKH